MTINTRLWREKRDADIKRRAEISAAKKEKTLAAAKDWLDDWYKEYGDDKDKAASKVQREAEEFLEKTKNTASSGTMWERTARLIDLSRKAEGNADEPNKERFRQLLLDLIKDSNAPGVKG